MILTTDALVGGTLSLALMSATTVPMANMAKKAAEIRRDTVAEQLVSYCNAGVYTDEDYKLNKFKLKAGAYLIGSECGASGAPVTIQFKSGAARVVSVDEDGLYARQEVSEYSD